MRTTLVWGGRPPEEILSGAQVRLESLRHDHVPGLVTAAAGGGELYRWSPVPQGEAQIRQYVETAVGARDSETAVPFAAVRAADDVVIGSTRFFDLGYWPGLTTAGSAPGRTRARSATAG